MVRHPLSGAILPVTWIGHNPEGAVGLRVKCTIRTAVYPYNIHILMTPAELEVLEPTVTVQLPATCGECTRFLDRRPDGANTTCFCQIAFKYHGIDIPLTERDMFGKTRPEWCPLYNGGLICNN